MYKEEKVEKKILILAGVLVLMATLGVSVAVLAVDNAATQTASSAKATSISIVGKLADTAVTTITFPAGAPSATVSVPYNSVEGDGDPQVLSGSVSEPVARLKNTSGGTLSVWLGITTWSEGVAAKEDYELIDPATTTITEVTGVLSADGNAANVDTSIEIGTSAYKALYLELTLSALAGKTGTSTLTILGET
jgi:hypothetical protein